MEQNQSIPPPTNSDDIQNISRLVRRGLLPNKDLPGLKIAFARLRQAGDIAKLPKNHRDVIQKYNAALNSAAFGSNASRMALVRNLQKEEVELEAPEQVLEQLADPPAIMVLKRKGIRMFPDGKRVALYSNDKLGLTFTVPYVPGSDKGMNVSFGVSEEVIEEQEDLLENIEHVIKYASEENPKNTSKHFKFSDGSKVKVAHGVARAMHMVHQSLNDDNKKKFADMLNAPESFNKAANFALSRVKFSIK